jgi:prefoldin beta subunit
MSAAEIDSKYEVYKELQGDIQKLYTMKQTSLSQFNENTLVKGELDLLAEDDSVFKLVGPALMKVDLGEAISNVAKRLEFIESEITKLDNQIAVKQGEQTKVGDEVKVLQSALQRNAASAAQQIADEVS